MYRRLPTKEGSFSFVKTALIKTDIWDDDTFYDLNIDTKLLYLLILTAPERGVGRIFKMSDRILVARSGLNSKQVEVCKKQLEEKGLVGFYNSWISPTERSSFIQPVKGKLTKIVLQRETDSIPKEVIEYFIDNSSENLQSGSRAVQVYDNDDVNDKDNDVDKDVVYGKPEINEMFNEWELIVGYKISSEVKRNRNACSNLLKKYNEAGVRQLISLVATSHTDKFSPRVSDFYTLQSKLNELLAWAKQKGATTKPKVVKI